ncbi:hypothetical protein ACT47M_004189, partial [Cronobacter muytjensii]
VRRGFQPAVARWRILRFPLSESTLNFRIFLSSLRLFREVLHIAVSMEAHYRDLSFQHNPFFDLFFQLPFFHAHCCDPARSAQRIHEFALAQRLKSNQSLHID